MSVSLTDGAQILMGRPGKPAPEPTSMTWGWAPADLGPRFKAEVPPLDSGHRWRAARMDSPKWRVTISSGSRTAVRLMRAFQRNSISIYIDIVLSWTGESTPASWADAALSCARGFGLSLKKGASNSAMRTSSMRFLIVDVTEVLECLELWRSNLIKNQFPANSSRFSDSANYFLDGGLEVFILHRARMIQRNPARTIDQDQSRRGAGPVEIEVLFADRDGNALQSGIEMLPDPLDVGKLILRLRIFSLRRVAIKLGGGQQH